MQRISAGDKGPPDLVDRPLRYSEEKTKALHRAIRFGSEDAALRMLEVALPQMPKEANYKFLGA